MDRIKFKINGEDHSVGCEVTSDMTLLDYLRDIVELKGTKYMCREGGCGACLVAAIKCPGALPTAVNSCLVSIMSCHDWEITTVEKVGNKLDGYHTIQKTLAEENGSQCGYCSPGWVMALYSLLQSKRDLTMLEIERSFGSNICRCTGYRPILEAFKKFAKDAPRPSKIMDIEDLYICKRNGRSCDKIDCDEDGWSILSEEDLKLGNVYEIVLRDGKKWFKVYELTSINNILRREGSDSYMYVAGNTAKGVYPIDEYPRILIDISDVGELKGYNVNQNLIVNAGNTLSEFLDILKRMSNEEYFGYLQKLYEHIDLVAHIPVRNVGTIAGNLMIKHQHNEFPSDIFLLLETIGAQITILNFFIINSTPQYSIGRRRTLTMQEFLKTDMRKKIILNVLLPPLNASCKLVTYKIMPRAQSAHAIVNAGFLYKLNARNDVIESRIVYGGLSTPYVRATATETFLIGKNLFKNETLQPAVKILENELVVTENPPEPSVAYRKQLAVALFYKGLLSLCPESILKPTYRSGAIRLRESRPVSSGKRVFDTNTSLWPLNQPVQKIEGLIQCSGEAPYTEDLPCLPREVYAAFVLSTVPTGNIQSIDPNVALNQQGVIAFYTAKDIPGLNSFTPADSALYSANEEILCSGAVKFYNQPIGIVVAESRHIAERAAKMVHIKYTNVKEPVVDIKEAKKDTNRTTMFASVDATSRGGDVTKVIKSGNTIYGQYHFTMETLVCVARPIEEGLEVHASTQWMDGVQTMISRALKMDGNKIDVHVRRLGGGYGMKISRSGQVAVACSLVVRKLNRPCRFILPLTTVTKAVGKRLPCSTEYEVGVNNSGVIQYMNYSFYEDNGFMVNETLGQFALDVISNCYNNAQWSYKCYNVLTDTAKNTWCRSPGTLEGIAMAEFVMEQISYEASVDPIEVRLANLSSTHEELREMVETLKTNAQYTDRRAAVNTFNGENRWKKRGLRISIIKWTPQGAQNFDVNISVLHSDGSVVITHGGIEMGQGVNTKAAQIAAYLLKIPMEKIQIKGNNTIIAPNCFISGGSFTSQNVGIAVRRCCEELLRRLEPIRSQLTNPTWEQVITAAFNANVDLQSHGFTSFADVQNYNAYGAALAEVEVDILTGESEVLRVDLLEDVGQSVSPEIDVGQAEGAFIMGLGYWTCEKLVYDNKTGELLTDRTWSYHVPQARDIPRDFRIYFKKKSYSNDLIFGSKVIGEPPICLSVVVPLAIREAIASARLENGIPTTQWFAMDGPYSMENVCLAAATKTSDFKYY